MNTVLDGWKMIDIHPETKAYNGLLMEDTTFKAEDGVGPLLRFVRTKENIAIEDIATALNKSMNYIYQIERGERKAPPTLLRDIAKQYKIANHYNLLIMIEGIITPDEYTMMKAGEFNSISETHTFRPQIDLKALLRGNDNSDVYFEKELLNEDEKNQILGAIKIILNRGFFNKWKSKK